jgi:2-polyprenyl-6-methoxyphenol hydroxylase-like FAD-dependent oxidoreductase
MPGAGAASGQDRASHFVWFRPADEEKLAELCTDAAGQRHGASIPPPLIRPELIAALRADAAAGLAPQIAAQVERTPLPFLQPIFDVDAPNIVFGRVALLGDAAFLARPHVASGVMKAALDAQGLADAIAAADDNLQAAVMRYELERRSFGRWLVARGRHIGRYFEAGRSQTGMEAAPRPDVIMREYGAAGLVDNEPIKAAQEA